MNEAVKTMSDLLVGGHCRTIVIGEKILTIKAPVIKVIVRAARFLALVEIPKDISADEMLKIASEQSENIVKGLSYLVAGDVEDYEEKATEIAEELQSGTHEELYSAFLVAFNLITGKELFQCASLAMELANLIIRPK